MYVSPFILQRRLGYISLKMLFSVIIEVIIHFCNIINEKPKLKVRHSIIMFFKSFFRVVLLFRQKIMSGRPRLTIGAESISKYAVNIPENKNIL